MDAQAQKKALFRAKLNAQKKEKRIESPLVRYNEFDQLVCRVCDVVLKHESNWDAHQISRKHREAISNLKANAAALAQQSHGKPVTDTMLPKLQPEHASEAQSKMPSLSQEQLKTPSSSMLPPDFFDNNDARKQRSGVDLVLTDKAVHLHSCSFKNIRTHRDINIYLDMNTLLI